MHTTGSTMTTHSATNSTEYRPPYVVNEEQNSKIEEAYIANKSSSLQSIMTTHTATNSTEYRPPYGVNEEQYAKIDETYLANKSSSLQSISSEEQLSPESITNKNWDFVACGRSYMTAENATHAVSYVGAQAAKISHLAQEGPLSFRVLAFLGGCAMIITSAADFLIDIATLSSIRALIAFYTFCFGVIICLLEGKTWACPSRYQKLLHRNARFLRFVWGRGCLYLFAGSLQLSQMYPLDIAVGGFMCFVGITSILVGKGTADKLSKLRRSLSDEKMVVQKFVEHDSDGDGYLQKGDFVALTRSLGLDLDHNELVAAFSTMDKDEDEKISFADFKRWWSGFKFGTTVDEAQMMI